MKLEQGKTYFFVTRRNFDEVTVKEVEVDEGYVTYITEQKDSGIFYRPTKRYSEWDIESLLEKGAIVDTLEEALKILIHHAESELEDAKKSVERCESNLNYLKNKLAKQG